MKSEFDPAGPSLMRALGFKLLTWALAIGLMVWGVSALTM